MNYDNIKIIHNYPISKDETDRHIARVIIEGVLLPKQAKKYGTRKAEAFKITQDIACELLENGY